MSHESVTSFTINGDGDPLQTADGVLARLKEAAASRGGFYHWLNHTIGGEPDALEELIENLSLGSETTVQRGVGIEFSGEGEFEIEVFDMFEVDVEGEANVGVSHYEIDHGDSQHVDERGSTQEACSTKRARSE